VLNVLSTAGASVLPWATCCHDLFPVSLKYGPIASDNPWNAAAWSGRLRLRRPL